MADLIVYIRRSDDAICKYTGLTEADALALIAAQGLTGTVISESDYNTALSAAQFHI